MDILNEIKRIKEIMGVKPHKPLLMEQSTMVRTFRNFMVKKGAKAVTTFKKTLATSGLAYKGFKLTLQGFAENSKISNDVLELVYEVLTKYPVIDDILKSPKLFNKYLKTLGIVMDDATAGVIGNRIALDGTDLGLNNFKKLVRAQTVTMKKFIVDLFPTATKSGASGITGPKIKFLKTIFNDANITNKKELSTYLAKFGFEDSAKIADDIVSGKVLGAEDFKDFFEKMVNNVGVEKAVTDFFGSDKTWKEMVKVKGVSKDNIKKLLGTSDIMTDEIYELLMQDSKFYRAKAKLDKLLSKTWFTIPTPSILGKGSGGIEITFYKFIFGYLPFTMTWNALYDYMIEKEFKTSFLSKTQSLDGDLYTTIKSNPGFFKRVSGISVKKAKEIAAQLKLALSPQSMPWELKVDKYREWCKDDKNWSKSCKSCFGTKERLDVLSDAEVTLAGKECISSLPAYSQIDFDAKRWFATNDKEVIRIFSEDIKTVIASSAVAYYYEKEPVGDSSNRLTDDLEEMTVTWVPPLITKSLAGLITVGGLNLQDTRAYDVLKIISGYEYIVNSTGENTKEAKNALIDAFSEFWPSMPTSLPDTECYCTKKVDGKWVDDLDTVKSVQNCNKCKNANIETWYTRKIGPVPVLLTNMLIESCEERIGGMEDATALQSCINGMDPMTMNIMCNNTNDPKLAGSPIYSPEYNPGNAEVMAMDGVEVIFGIEAADDITKVMEKIRKKYDPNYEAPKNEDER